MNESRDTKAQSQYKERSQKSKDCRPTRWIGVLAELFRGVPEVEGQSFGEGEAEQLCSSYYVNFVW